MYRYFNPDRVTHAELLKFLSSSIPRDKDVVMIGYGTRTQHLFRDGKYLMTINWNLV